MTRSPAVRAVRWFPCRRCPNRGVPRIQPASILRCLIVWLATLAGLHAADEPLIYERFEGKPGGNLQGDVQFVPEVIGYGGLVGENRASARFDGKPGTVIRFDPEIKVTAPDFTVEAFVKPDETASYAALVADWDETDDQRAWALVLCAGNGLRFDVMPDGKFHPANALTTSARLLRAGSWYHVAAVSQGNVSRVYVNGRLGAEKQRGVAGIFKPTRRSSPETGTPSSAARTPEPASGIQIGNAVCFAGKPRPFAGWIDEVRITPRALAPSEFLKTRDPLPEPKGPVPDKYELSFTAITREDALAWQQRARRRLFELVAVRTPKHSLAERPLDFRIASTEDRGTYTLHQGSFQGNDGRRYACRWTVPKRAGLSPALLCLHGHGGSAEAVWDPQKEYGAFARRLAEGGYCTLTPSFPHRAYAAETLWDLLRCVDLLVSRTEVDAQRIGVMGLSMGGEWTMWVAACDERLKAAVVSGWMCTTEGVFAVPNCSCWELPGFVELMDVCEVNLLLAPRPALFESAESDPCFLLRYTREGFARIRAGYQVFGAADAAVHDVFPGGHKVHGTLAYPFLDRILGGHAARPGLPPAERR